MAVKKDRGKGNMVLTLNDIDIITTCYLLRLARNKSIHEFLYEDDKDKTYSIRSLQNRTKRLEDEGFLESTSIIPFTPKNRPRIYTYEKAYRVTETGLSVAIDRLDIELNVYGPTGMVAKYHPTVEELTINKQFPHHFKTLDVVVMSSKEMKKRIQSIQEDIFSLIHGSGRDYPLHWDEQDSDGQKVRTIRPDWVFFKPVRSEETPICLEEDMSTMKPVQLFQKFVNYQNHIDQNKEKYRHNPLHLVVSVLDDDSNKKRRRGIMQNVFTTFENSLLEETITLDVLGNSHSPSRIAEIYEGTVFDHMPEFPETSVETFLEGSQSAYQLKNVYVKDQHYSFKNLAFQPEFCILFQRPNGQQLSVFLVSMRNGNMNSHSQLIHLQEIIEEEKLNALVIGLYPTLEEMNKDVFMDFTIQKEFRQRVIQLQSQVILSTEEELNEKRAYRVSTNLSRNNSQRLSVVNWKDVIR